MGFQAEAEVKDPLPLGVHGGHVSLDDGGGGVPGDDQGLSAVDDGGELGLPGLELLHEALVVVAQFLNVQVPVGEVPVGLDLLLLVEPGQLGVSRGHEVVKGVEVGHPLVGQDEELVVGLLEDGHPLAVDLQLLAVESNLGLAAFLHVALELEVPLRHE